MMAGDDMLEPFDVEIKKGPYRALTLVYTRAEIHDIRR